MPVEECVEEKKAIEIFIIDEPLSLDQVADELNSELGCAIQTKGKNLLFARTDNPVDFGGLYYIAIKKGKFLKILAYSKKSAYEFSKVFGYEQQPEIEDDPFWR